MLNENLITTLETSLRQTKSARQRIEKHLESTEIKIKDLENEVEIYRLEIADLTDSEKKIETALESLLTIMNKNRNW